MAITWNEVRSRAMAFSKEWENVTRENAEAKPFWEALFQVFGVSRRRFASFEEPVKLLKKRRGFIDLLWKGVLLVEHKSRGEDLDSAYTQAMDYFEGIAEEDLPRYVLVSDFARFRLHDLEAKTRVDFDLKKLHEHVKHLGFILGYSTRAYAEEAPVNIEAAELMAKLHDILEASGYDGHKLEVFLVRVLFCLFADDTGIITPKDHLRHYLETRTSEDGSDMGPTLGYVFQILDTHSTKRPTTLDEDLATLPHVNGKLFCERFDLPSFDSKSRAVLLKCAAFNWSAVSPAVFGSMFQKVMKKEERRNLGAHYTSETNILKALDPLFLDDLRERFNEAKTDAKALDALMKDIATIRIFDPACGCGNFLIIAYRELRRLEIDITSELIRLKQAANEMVQQVIDVASASFLNVDCVYGIEVEEFPARIAETAMWLVDHQMNTMAEEVLGGSAYIKRLPLRVSAKILNGNALSTDWSEFAPKDKIRYVVGNPPFVGKKRRSASQKTDMGRVFKPLNVKKFSELDYVSCWYAKAAEYIQGTEIRVAFVSTNSITQGEQVAILWPHIFAKGLKFEFAHRTFRWSNFAPGPAQVWVVIIGLSLKERRSKRLFVYIDPNKPESPDEIRAQTINAYLIDYENVFVYERRRTIDANAPVASFGSMPNDDGQLLLDDDEKKLVGKLVPSAVRYIRPLLSAHEFLHGKLRWCLWLVEVQPNVLHSKEWLPIRQRIEHIRTYRQASPRIGTKKAADTPMLFAEIRQPDENYILISRHSLEDREYIPMAIVGPTSIASDSCIVVRSDDLYHFGVLHSAMHMAWIRQICGRLTGRYRYSVQVVYNNFPWPDSVTTAQRTGVAESAKEVLASRRDHPDATLDDMYNQLAMPQRLRKAHRTLDRLVDNCYRKQLFPTELARMRLLFDLYLARTRPLLPTVGKKRP